MTDTPSSILLLRLQSTGSNTNLWGGYINTSFQTLEQASKGWQTLAVTGDATISWTNYATGNVGQCGHLGLSGSLTFPAILTFPTNQNWLIVHNNTGASVTIKCSGGTGVIIPNGKRVPVFCNGTDYFDDGPNWTGNLYALVNNGDYVLNSHLTAAIAAITAGSVSGLVLTSTSATQATYLLNALTSSGGVSISKVNAGTSSEQVLIGVGALAVTVGAAQTGNFAAVVNTQYILTKSGNVTVTLPSAASPQDTIVIDIGGSTGIVTFALNGLKYYGTSTNPSTASEGTQIFRYHSAARGWVDV